MRETWPLARPGYILVFMTIAEEEIKIVVAAWPLCLTLCSLEAFWSLFTYFIHFMYFLSLHVNFLFLYRLIPTMEMIGMLYFFPITASLPIDDWERGMSTYLFHAYADDSLIRPLFASVIRHLSPLGDVFNAVTDFLHAVDVARPAIQNVVNDNFLMETGSSSIVRPELINLLLNSFLTDESNFSFPDSTLFRWATSRAVEVGNEPLDIRRSLHNFFQVCLFLSFCLVFVEDRRKTSFSIVFINFFQYVYLSRV